MKEEQTTEISIQQLFSIFIVNLKWILLATFLTALIFLFVSAVVIEPKYTARTSLYVYNPEISTTTTTAYTTGSYIAELYMGIIESESVADAVIKELNLDISTSALKKMITTSSIKSDQIIEMKVTNADPIIAQKIAMALTNIVPEKLISTTKAGSVEIIDYAKIPQNPSSPSIPKNTIIGAALGFLLSTAAFIVISLLDNKLRTEEDLTDNFQLPILGSIPTITTSSKTEAK